MSREYKFRGLTKEGKWVYGSWIEYNQDKPLSFIGYPVEGKNAYEWSDVNTETVGECTGKQDSKGTKIFRRDLCRVRPSNTRSEDAERIFNTKIFKVVWLDHEAMYALEERCDYLFGFDEIDEILVVGNEDENPELLVEGPANE